MSIPIDINECETDNGGCQQNCHNRDGSFYCSCNSGYIISVNHLDCDGKFCYLLYILLLPWCVGDHHSNL